MQGFPPRAMKGLYDSEKIRFLRSKLPCGEKEEKFQRRKGIKRKNTFQLLPSSILFKKEHSKRQLLIWGKRRRPQSHLQTGFLGLYLFFFKYPGTRTSLSSLDIFSKQGAQACLHCSGLLQLLTWLDHAPLWSLKKWKQLLLQIALERFEN